MRLILTIFIAVVALTRVGHADVKPSQFLAPEDIGAFKWIVGATGSDHEIVILRQIRTSESGNKKDKIIHDIVFYDPGKRCEGTFVAINPNYFNAISTEGAIWHISAFGNAAWCRGKYETSETRDNYGMICFRDKEGGLIKYEFTAITMRYEEATKIYTDFPENSSVGWKWGGTPNLN